MEKETKKKKRMTPAQLANLRPIKPGEVRNPNGGRAHDPVKQALRNLTIKEYREVIEVALRSNVAGLKAFLSDKNASAIQVAIASGLLKSFLRGDVSVLEMLASRLIGKVPDKVEVATTSVVHVSFEDREKLRQTINELWANV
jgi:hypothetical protein